MVFTLVGEQLRSLERGQVIIIGALLVLLVIFLPKGVVSFPEKIGSYFKKAGSHSREEGQSVDPSYS